MSHHPPLQELTGSLRLEVWVAEVVTDDFICCRQAGQML